MKLIIASSNKNKIAEIKEMLNNIEIMSLSDIDFNDEIEETGKTFEENALIKAQTIYKKYNVPVIADDSGLCVNALMVPLAFILIVLLDLSVMMKK